MGTDRQLTRDPSIRGSTIAGRPRRSSPFAILALVLFLVAAGLAGALVLQSRASNQQIVPLQATVVALRTALLVQQVQAVVRQTEVAQLQARLVQLQGTITTAQTPTRQANGPHGYLASFQVDKYSYILFLQWDEADGFIHNCRLLATDNYVRKGTKSFQCSGVDNSGSIGFTARDQHVTLTFSGTATRTGTLTLSGVPWYVFYGFAGGTFSQTLHAGTLQDYNAAVANIANPPQ